MRIDKLLSHALNLTRNEARQEIKKGNIIVNDKVIYKNDFFVDCYFDEILYKNEKIKYKEFIYLMMNKPKGYLSATYDKNNKTVIDLLNDDFKKKDVSMVGRLDIDTEGLLLLTNDGALLHKLTAPRYDVYKKYYVEVDGIFNNSDIESFKEGLEITDGSNNLFKTKEAILEIIEPSKAYISITEGKYHQVKKMCRKLGKEVTYLKRVEMKGIKLDKNLRPGETRELTEEETKILLSTK